MLLVDNKQTSAQYNKLLVRPIGYFTAMDIKSDIITI